MDPSRSEVFRGLGGAYQSQGQHQMAFASYQQAINVAPTDLLAYLKLGLLYEELVSATRCIDRLSMVSRERAVDVIYQRSRNARVFGIGALGRVL